MTDAKMTGAHLSTHMSEWEHPLSPNLGKAVTGHEIPPIDYLDWYVPRLQAGVEHDMTQSGFKHPWDWNEAFSDSDLNSLADQFSEPPLNPAIWIAERHGVPVDMVSGGHGVCQSLLFALTAVLDPGKPRRVAVEMPSFAVVSQFPRILGCEVIPFNRGPKESGDCGPWNLDREELADILPSVGAIVTTPVQNPSGWMMSEDDQNWLVDACKKHGVGIVSDEVYLDSTIGTDDYRPMYEFGEHCISVNSLTKCYGLGPLRLGWVIGSPQRIQTARRVMQTTQGMLAVPSLRMAEAVWPRIDEPLVLMKERREKNLPRLMEVLARNGINWTPPPTGIYGCIELPGGWTGEDAVDQVAAPIGLLVTPCAMFAPQLKGYIRIAWGDDPDSFTNSLEAFEKFLKGLK